MKPHNKIINLLFFFSLFIACSRGLFETFLDKDICYIIQASSWALFIYFSFFFSSRITKTPYFTINSILFFSFILIIFFSSLFTFITYETMAFFIYSFVTLYFCVLLYISSSLNLNIVSQIKFEIHFSIIIWILILGAILQQTGLWDLPGISHEYSTLEKSLRPSSFTGSYLHYPIVLALLGFLLFEISRQRKKWFYLLTSFVAFFGVFISFSRSGSMIIIFGFTLYALKLKNLKSKKGNLFLLFLIFIFIIGIIYSSELLYFERILSSIDLTSSGNEGRVQSWLDGIEMWLKSPLFIGSYTGLVTNTSNNFNTAESQIVESSLLQQLLNFGLIGLLLYYALLFMIVFKIAKKHQWLKVAAIAAIFESFVYQSIEVFPFMIILSIFPLVSYYLLNNTNNFSLKKKV